MSFDLFQSRRTYNELCHWWSRNESDEYEDDELIMKQHPTGSFYAKEVSSEATHDVAVGGVFMFDKTTITLKSPDNLFGMKGNDLIEYQGEKWMVVNVQKKKTRISNSEFANDKDCSHMWYLEIRK